MTLNNKDFPKFDSAKRDKLYWDTIEDITKTRDYSHIDLLRHWQAYVMRRDLPRFLSHYELFKNVIDLPGCVIDLGVWRGASLFTWSNLMESFCPYDRSRKVFGFDMFEGLADFDAKDGADDRSVQKNAGGYYATKEEVSSLIESHNADNMIPGTRRVELVEGDIKDTLPNFLEQNPGLRISLLHFDMDLYKPTKYALEMLYPLVLDGGVVCFDEYGLVPWQGETTAVEEYFDEIGCRPKFKKHSWAQTPHGYFIKGE